MLLGLFRAPSRPAARRLAAHVAVVVAYAVSGKLSMLLAVPPGYASPIFPPAGIAIAAVLIEGAAALPWVLLGSFALNLWIGGGAPGGLSAVGLVAAVSIAIASAIQAAIGGGVLRRTIGYPALLDNSRDLFCFLALSPILCLVSASLSVAALWALGVTGAAEAPGNWLCWWIGDTLGLLVVLPLLLVIAGEPRALWRSRGPTVGLPMLLLFTLFVVIFVRVSSWERSDALTEARLLSQQTVDKIRNGLAEQAMFLRQLERSFSGSTEVRRADFAHLVQPLLARYPMIQAVEWAPRVEAAALAGFEARQREEVPGFAVRAVGGGRLADPAAGAGPYYPVTDVEPVRGNEKAIGVDLASDPDRAAALRLTEAGGRVAATPPIRLVQETADQSGLLLLLSVPGGANGPGVVLTVMRVSTFLDALLAPIEPELALRFEDTGAKRPLFDTFHAPPPATVYVQSFDFGGRRYRVTTTPTAAYLARHPHWQSWAVLVAGLLGTGLLGALLLLGTGYTRRIETVVDERTRDLETANRRLADESRERQAAEAALRQAQRLESIGQLTGGIAHDFNNLLTVVSGNAALLQEAAGDPAASARRVGAILRAAERGERLTRQLLAFSRRQMLRPEAVDLRQRSGELAEMLTRSLRGDIALSFDLPEDLWPVAVDAGEFELALLNIGVNARDAMPHGGSLRVAARNASELPADLAAELPPGDYVAVELTDTGAGMPPAVLARAFEPYFTTKEAGLGSGLGLSQVYGFAKQSGGAVTLASTPGEGTRITFHLPRAPGAAAPAPEARPAPPAGPGLRILLVEDDRDVAEATAGLLAEAGHRIVQVADGEAAFRLVDRDPAIDLVLSDIVMAGGLSGLDLARQLRRRRPGLPVLLATGYSDYAGPAIGEGFILLEKPYRRDALLAAVRAAVAGARDWVA